MRAPTAWGRGGGGGVVVTRYAVCTVLQARTPTPDMHADVLKDLTFDDDDTGGARAPSLTGVKALTARRPVSPIRTAPRLTPITARNAGRGVNATHRGLLHRASRRAWREHALNQRGGGGMTVRARLLAGGLGAASSGASLPPVVPQTARW